MSPSMRDNIRAMFRTKHGREVNLVDEYIDQAIKEVGTFGATADDTDQEILETLLRLEKQYDYRKLS